MSALLNLHDAVAPSRANGPGARAVLFVQGCSLACPGCHNPDTWRAEVRRVATVDAVAAWYRSFRGLRGITLSGGEPFEQAWALARLCSALRREGADVVAFSGLTRGELEGAARPHARALLAEVDLLVDGRFEVERAGSDVLRGSSNQRLHFLTDRIRPRDVEALPRSELVLGGSGRARVTGFGTAAARRLLGRAGVIEGRIRDVG